MATNSTFLTCHMATVSLGERLGQRLRARRKARGLSQASLAEVLDLSPNFVGLVERGAKLPALDTLELMANAVGTTPDELLGGSGTTDPWLDQITAIAEAISPERRTLTLKLLRSLAEDDDQ